MVTNRRLFFVLSTITVSAISRDTTGQNARQADVQSIDAIVTAVYEAISGSAGTPRDWERFRSLFAEGARLIPTTSRDGVVQTRPSSVEEYIERVTPFFDQNGFFETESHRVTEQYGNIAHAFSTYESRRSPDDPEPFVRGINSFQLMYDGSRWWVVNVFWVDERLSGDIPEKYRGARE